MQSVYIHIPFCKKICSYCDFPKMIYDNEMADDYLEALANEISNIYDGTEISTIYIGGGTPSCLTHDQLLKLFEITNIFNKNKLFEFTIEANLEDITSDFLEIIKTNGVTRLSIGIQTFNSNFLELINRHADFNDAKEKIMLVKSYGIHNINLDLMYAFPNQKLGDLKKDLKMFLKLEPTHISTYSLILEENTKLYIEKYENISDELDSEMYDYICKKLSKNGFNHYEVSNFALPKYESIHNTNYWLNNEYYGFGLGAHGFIQGFRYENTHSLNEYINGVYRLRDYLVSYQEMMENELMLGFRLLKGINIKRFYERYHENIQDVFPIKPLLKSGELMYKGDYIFINPSKIYVMDSILLKLV